MRGSDWRRASLLIVALTAVAANGCSASETVADDRIASSSSSSRNATTSISQTALPADTSAETDQGTVPTSTEADSRSDDTSSGSDGVRPPSSASDEELAEALAETMSECVAREVVKRIGGNELRALGWTPAMIQSPGFSPFIELEPDQYHILNEAVAECSDPVSHALQQSIAFSASQVDRNCLLEALGPEPKQTILKSSPVSPAYDGEIGLGNALLNCLDPVEFVAALWTTVASRYSSDAAAGGVDTNASDQACIADWLGNEQRATALTLFELIRSFHFVDDPSSPLVDQLDRLNQVLTTGKMTAPQLDQLHDCFKQ